MTPTNLKLQKIALPELNLLMPLLSSIPRDEILDRLLQQRDLECFQSRTLVFDEDRRLTIEDYQVCRRPTKEFATDLMNCVFSHFCTGTYWFFGGVLTLLESCANGEKVVLDTENYIQLLAVIATLYDSESNPVVLYPVDLLV